MRISVFKEYLNRLLSDDLNAPVFELAKLPSPPNVCGHVKFQTGPKTFSTIDISSFPDTGLDEQDGARIALFVEGGAEIMIADGALRLLSKTPSRLKAILAHEVGHFLTNNRLIENYITPDKWNKQTRFLERAKKFPEQSHIEQKYYRAMFSSLLRGGVMHKELAADLVAVQYVPIDSLIAIHSDKLRHVNIAVRLEAHNRIKELSWYRERAVDEQSKVMKVKLLGARLIR